MKSITAVAIAGLCLVMMTLPSQLYALPSRYAYSSEMEQKYDTDELDMAIMEALAHMSESDAETEEGDYDDYEDDMPLEIQTIANNMQRLPETRREVTVKNCKWYGDLIGNAIGFTLHNALPAKFRDAYTVYIDCKAPRTKCTRVRVGYHRFSGTASGLDIAADVEVCKKPGSKDNNIAWIKLLCTVAGIITFYTRH